MTSLTFSSTEMENLNSLCRTLDAKYFYKLPRSKQVTLAKLSATIIKSPFWNPAIDWPESIPTKNRIRKPKANLALAFIMYRSVYPYKQFQPARGAYPVDDLEIWESKKYNMKIMLIYDPHMESRKLYPPGFIPVQDFIANEIKASNAPIDLYLERRYRIYETVRWSEGALEDVRFKFQDCFAHLKDNCKYYNLRSHLVDMRSIEFDPIMRFVNGISGIGRPDVATVYLKYLNEEPRLKDILKNESSFTEYVWEKVTSGRIAKNLKAINEPEIKAVIYKFLCHLLQVNSEHRDTAFKKLEYDYIKDILTKFTSTPKGTAQWRERDSLAYEIGQSFYEYFGLIMDVYTLARLFRSYEANKQNNYYFSGRARNAIIFVGGAHAVKYSNVFKELGFENTYSSFYDVGDKSERHYLNNEEYETNFSIFLSKLQKPVFQVKP